MDNNLHEIATFDADLEGGGREASGGFVKLMGIG